MSRRKKGQVINGWVVIDKPQNIGSTKIVAAVRRAFDAQKAGHAGTLDPLATGVVAIALGEATKTVPYAMDLEKIYQCRIRWGDARDTDDADGQTIATSDTRPTLAAIEQIIPRFIGDIIQTPPAYSAIKINGQRAYDIARAGDIPDIKERTVTIHDIAILAHDTDWLDLEITCGKGTYIRSIARDMGEILGCYGHIEQLRRLAVGVFSVENAISLDFLEKNSHSAALLEQLLPVEIALDDIPAFPISEQEAARLRQGQTLSLISRQDYMRLQQAGIEVNNPDDNGVIALAQTKSGPVALVHIQGTEIKPDRVLNL